MSPLHRPSTDRELFLRLRFLTAAAVCWFIVAVIAVAMVLVGRRHEHTFFYEVPSDTDTGDTP